MLLLDIDCKRVTGEGGGFFGLNIVNGNNALIVYRGEHTADGACGLYVKIALSVLIIKNHVALGDFALYNSGVNIILSVHNSGENIAA